MSHKFLILVSFFLVAQELAAADLSTPEAAIRTLENAYLTKNEDAAVAAKDFQFEARQMLTQVRGPGKFDESLVTTLASKLEARFRSELKNSGFPDFKGLQCTFVEKYAVQADLVAMLEECVFPDHGVSRQKVYAAKSQMGWRNVVITDTKESEKKQDQTVMIKGQDSEMKAAIAHAQSTLDEFLRIKANPPVGASDFRLKVKVSDAHGTEHMWVMPFSQIPNGFSGVLADEPDYVKTVKYGQKFSFSREDVSDWGYILNGKQKGSFTVCVSFKHMPKSEADKYRHDYGFEC